MKLLINKIKKMKKLLLTTLGITAFQFIVNAQTLTTIPGVGLRMDPAGNTKLTIRKSLTFSPTSGTDREINFDLNTEVGRINADANGTFNAATIELYGNNHSDNDRKGQITFVSGYSANPTGTKFNFFDRTATGWNPLMRIYQDGKVVIGDYSTSQWTSTKYGLYVQYGIITEQVKVAIRTTSDWSDYVFNKDYKMMPLKQLEKFIQANKHLPEVPSAQEVVDGGLDLAKMDAKLLQKIEELTLYTIELNKQLEAMKEKLSLLETQK